MDNNKILNISGNSLQKLTIEQIVDLKLEVDELLSEIDYILNENKEEK